MLEEFDKLVEKRDQLRQWWLLGETVAKYDRKKFQLRVDIEKPLMVSFCGQMSQGSQNYHDAPKFFFEAIRKRISESIEDLTREVYEAELERLNGLIEDNRSAVMAQLNQAEA